MRNNASNAHTHLKASARIACACKEFVKIN